MIAFNASAPTNNLEFSWHTIEWSKRYKIVKRLQARIVKVTQENRWSKVKALQRLLICFLVAKLWLLEWLPKI